MANLWWLMKEMAGLVALVLAGVLIYLVLIVALVAQGCDPGMVMFGG